MNRSSRVSNGRRHSWRTRFVTPEKEPRMKRRPHIGSLVPRSPVLLAVASPTTWTGDRRQRKRQRILFWFSGSGRFDRRTRGRGGLCNECRDRFTRYEAAAPEDYAGEFATAKQGIDRVPGNSAQ